MSNNTKYIFLSPHLDDAIFSCGDYISKLTSEGEIVLGYYYIFWLPFEPTATALC
ncbi:N-acetylglucosaminylphosphatidylinositol deacetylase superfamily [Streptococcus pneumoniae]|nr:N-acetylglucosaminylphosphatidylinositol deacetylase superfamily [Streptococcus pneumoniae]VMK64809.1 N-acetylglucosaminylphosphatidylinositol deacetylase superfamily [Streptococcus pneumoniae]